MGTRSKGRQLDGFSGDGGKTLIMRIMWIWMIVGTVTASVACRSIDHRTRQQGWAPFATEPKPTGQMKRRKEALDRKIDELHTLLKEYPLAASDPLGLVVSDAQRLRRDQLRRIVYSRDFELHYLSFHKWQQNAAKLANQSHADGLQLSEAGATKLVQDNVDEGLYDLEVLPSKCSDSLSPPTPNIEDLSPPDSHLDALSNLQEEDSSRGDEIDIEKMCQHDDDPTLSDVKDVLDDAYRIALHREDTTGGAILLSAGLMSFALGAGKYQLPFIKNKGFVAMETTFGLALAYFGYRLLRGDTTDVTATTAATLMVASGVVGAVGSFLSMTTALSFLRGLRNEQIDDVMKIKVLKPIFNTLGDQADARRITSKTIGVGFAASSVAFLGFALFKIFQGGERLGFFGGDKQDQNKAETAMEEDEPALDLTSSTPVFLQILRVERELIVLKKQLVDELAQSN